MKGRIYDPTLGRLLQADPFIQAPKNSQSFNRYSYVLNNPMSYTDPSGYFSVSSFLKQSYKRTMMVDGRYTAHKFTAKNPNLHGIGTAALNLIPIFGPLASAHANFDHSFVKTGSFGAAIRAGGYSYVSSWASGSEWYDNLSFLGQYAVDYGISVAFGQQNDAQRETAEATVGGTYSSLTGGKFANGAVNSSDLNGHADRFELYRKLEERFEYVRTINGKEIRRNYIHTVYTENSIDDALSFALSVRGALRAKKIDLLDGVSMPTGLAYATTFTYDLPLIRFYEVEVLYRRNLSKPFQAPENRGEFSKRYNVREEFSIRHGNFVGSETSLAYCNDGFGCSKF